LVSNHFIPHAGLNFRHEAQLCHYSFAAESGTERKGRENPKPVEKGVAKTL